MDLFKREPAAVGAVVAAVYALASAVHGAVTGTGVVDLDTIVAAVSAVYAFVVRSQVTPLADPRDKDMATLVSTGPVRGV